MKKYDIVKIINISPYKSANLKLEMHGIIIDTNLEKSSVLFFNNSNYGDYAVIKINNIDLCIENHKLPEEMKKELNSKIEQFLNENKNIIEPIAINAYDIVELIVEDEKYTKYGIHKGNTGCVMEDYAVQNYVEVDFSGIDCNGKYYGDCISVKISDLKVISNQKD